MASLSSRILVRIGPDLRAAIDDRARRAGLNPSKFLRRELKRLVAQSGDDQITPSAGPA